MSKSGSVKSSAESPVAPPSLRRDNTMLITSKSKKPKYYMVAALGPQVVRGCAIRRDNTMKKTVQDGIEYVERMTRKTGTE
ncbi:hypothetical protein BV898_14257 [Hypsibius exemplaris]|uniref:Uncharacterized protein n=1 Tax=Hypsibius exemplaris TaxID=2072580 RepID=A0A1W0W8D0_HYPEX|nr:hypothetical protein BV898_14257 [Hypsibius exemplaris]